MAKPFVQRLTSKELMVLDYDHQTGKEDNRCPDCRNGVTDMSEKSHRQFPKPCAFHVKVEIGRRLLAFDKVMESLESAKRWWRF